MNDITNPELLLEFPCSYIFKAVGSADEYFQPAVVNAVENHVTVIADNVRCRPSGKGNYMAVSVLVTLHSYEQLVAIYADLKQVAGVKMLL